MRAAFALAFLWSSAALAQATEVELFTDRGDLFVKAGTNHGVQVGASLTILGDRIGNTAERRRVGTATVMEVWPTLSRVVLDDAAKADKAAKKYVALSQGKVVEAPPEGAPGAAPARPEKAEKPAGAPPAGAVELKGHATFGGAGPWKVLRLWNDGAYSWSSCNVALMPGNRAYKMPRLKARDVESIALSNFVWKGPELDVTHTWVDVRCAEGSGKFTFPD